MIKSKSQRKAIDPKKTVKVEEKKSPESSLVVKKIKTVDLQLTFEELIHLRDVMSILLPPDGSITVSQSLAAAEKRVMPEAKLWSKVADACKNANIPTDTEAPDFVVGISGMPTLSVYPINFDKE